MPCRFFHTVCAACLARAWEKDSSLQPMLRPVAIEYEAFAMTMKKLLEMDWYKLNLIHTVLTRAMKTTTEEERLILSTQVQNLRKVMDLRSLS